MVTLVFAHFLHILIICSALPLITGQNQPSFVLIKIQSFWGFLRRTFWNSIVMAIGNGRGYQLRRANSETAVGEGLGFINSTRMIGRKRIVVSHCLDVSSFTSPPTTPPRKRSAIKVSSEKSLLEALPQDILVRSFSRSFCLCYCFLHFHYMIPSRILFFFTCAD